MVKRPDGKYGHHTSTREAGQRISREGRAPRPLQLCVQRGRGILVIYDITLDEESPLPEISKKKPFLGAAVNFRMGAQRKSLSVLLHMVLWRVTIAGPVGMKHTFNRGCTLVWFNFFTIIFGSITNNFYAACKRARALLLLVISC